MSAPTSEEVVARTEFLGVAADGAELSIAVEIGRPEAASEGTWTCPVAIHGLGGAQAIQAADPIQALALALALAWQTLERFVRDGGRLFGVTEPEEWSLDELRALFGRTDRR
jgi:hypothetical protein